MFGAKFTVPVNTPPAPPPPIPAEFGEPPPAPPPATTTYCAVITGTNFTVTPPVNVMPPVISNAIVLSYRFIVYLVEYPRSTKKHPRVLDCFYYTEFTDPPA
jgi:hypothetical protein